MPSIATFLYSEDSVSESTLQGQKMSVINPQMVFRPMFVPSLFSFAVTFGISNIDPFEEHKGRFIFWGPEEGEPVVDSGEFTLPKSDEPSDLPIEYRGFMMNLNFRNVPFKREGTYFSEIIIDGQALGRFPIYVKGKEKA